MVSITTISSIFLCEKRTFVFVLKENLTSRNVLTLRFVEKSVQKIYNWTEENSCLITVKKIRRVLALRLQQRRFVETVS